MISAPGALGDADLLAALLEADQLGDHDLERVGVVAERLDRGAHPCHVAVVVRAPHVDEQVVAPGELVAVIGDVRQQVGELAVALDQHPVLVVAELAGAQPHRAVVLVGHAAIGEIREGGGDGTGVDHRALGEPPVEVHVHATEDGRLLVQRVPLAPLQGVGVGRASRRPTR